jgi:glutathione S-transferase
LITEQTPNGKKVQILLEELKDVYGTSWTTSLLNLDAPNPEQNKDWFLRLNPNGTPTRTPYLLECGQLFEVF